VEDQLSTFSERFLDYVAYYWVDAGYGGNALNSVFQDDRRRRIDPKGLGSSCTRNLSRCFPNAPRSAGHVVASG